MEPQQRLDGLYSVPHGRVGRYGEGARPLRARLHHCRMNDAACGVRVLMFARSNRIDMWLFCYSTLQVALALRDSTRELCAARAVIQPVKYLVGTEPAVMLARRWDKLSPILR